MDTPLVEWLFANFKVIAAAIIGCGLVYAYAPTIKAKLSGLKLEPPAPTPAPAPTPIPDGWKVETVKPADQRATLFAGLCMLTDHARATGNEAALKTLSQPEIVSLVMEVPTKA